MVIQPGRMMQILYCTANEVIVSFFIEQKNGKLM